MQFNDETSKCLGYHPIGRAGVSNDWCVIFSKTFFFVGLYFAKVLDLIADKYDDCPRGYPVGNVDHYPLGPQSLRTSRMLMENFDERSDERLLSLQEVQRHNKTDDAWIVINGKVF